MERMKKMTVVVFVAAALLVGLSITMLHDASGQGKVYKKYDYTGLDQSVAKAVKGVNGETVYTDEMKKLLDQGWRIVNVMPGFILLERER